jgi:hypothetical protein
MGEVLECTDESFYLDDTFLFLFSILSFVALVAGSPPLL